MNEKKNNQIILYSQRIQYSKGTSDVIAKRLGTYTERPKKKVEDQPVKEKKKSSGGGQGGTAGKLD